MLPSPRPRDLVCIMYGFNDMPPAPSSRRTSPFARRLLLSITGLSIVGSARGAVGLRIDLGIVRSPKRGIGVVSRRFLPRIAGLGIHLGIVHHAPLGVGHLRKGPSR